MTALTSRCVHTPAGVIPATVHLIDGRVASIGPPGDGFDLGELALMPGVVDTHVHVNEPGRTEWEGFVTATSAAALGGVTTLADMPLNSLPVTTTLAALEAKIASAVGKLRVDVALWGGIVPGNTPELAPMVARGTRGFKCFLCPSGIDEFPASTEANLLRAMPELRRLGVPLLVHAELEGELRDAVAGDVRDYATYLHSRPPEWEDAAVAMMVDLCRRTGCRVHIVHLSSAGALAALRSAKAEGLPITAETCPHYLCLRAEDVPPGATEFKCAPPIREGANRDALWAALADGTLDFVVTDHSPCIPGLKLPDEGDFMRAWGGIASLQLGLASVCTEARRRGFGLAQITRWMTEGPRALLGLPSGAIAVGASADLIAFDPHEAFVVEGADLAHRHPTTPYAGRRLCGRVHHVWLRGQPIVRHGALVGPPQGRLLLEPPGTP
ncbi:MAG: allantoinase [Myxococcota bacterium]|jgi:allantoinase